MEINARFNTFLEIIDARACISVFVSETECIRQNVRVYEVLSDNDFLKTYGRDYITGLTVCLGTTNILIDHKERT